MLNLIEIGKKIYDVNNPREAHRLVVFLARGTFRYAKLNDLYQYFQRDDVRRKILERNPFAIEQATRAFFYCRSKFSERVELIKEHYDFTVKKFTPEWAVKLAKDGPLPIWQSDNPDAPDWSATINFVAGQRKEGLQSLIMYYKGKELYQIMFWFQKNKTGEYSVFIGAIQGANSDNATELIKETTKLSHRYRTKNLILYMFRAVVRSLGVKHIYAVSNEGYYANNHVRRDRKLKTDFGAFWLEAGGNKTDDARFYELPLVEPRKTMEEVPTRKRAVYRRRFDFLDAIDETVAANVIKAMKEDGRDASAVG